MTVRVTEANNTCIPSVGRAIQSHSIMRTDTHPSGLRAMHKIKTEFKAVSPMLHRRWAGKFYNPRIKPRLRKSWRPTFGNDKPHGQES